MRVVQRSPVVVFGPRILVKFMAIYFPKAGVFHPEVETPNERLSAQGGRTRVARSAGVHREIILITKE